MDKFFLYELTNNKALSYRLQIHLSESEMEQIEKEFLAKCRNQEDKLPDRPDLAQDVKPVSS